MFVEAKRTNSWIVWGVGLAVAVFFASSLASSEPPPEIDSSAESSTEPENDASEGLVVPQFIPPWPNTKLTPEILPYLSRLRETIGSPLSETGWSEVLPASAEQSIDADASSDFSVEAEVFQTLGQLRTAASTLEKAAAHLENEGKFASADELRRHARGVWKKARAIEGWSNSE